jgi:hypothetical protein
VTPNEAADLATRITQTWTRGGVAAHIWEDALLDLEPGRATTAYVRLRKSEQHAPSVARFLDQYHSLHLDDASTRGPDCLICDNTGWVTGADIIRRLPDGTETHRASSVQPCHMCATGKARGPVLAAIHRTNQPRRQVDA